MEPRVRQKEKGIFYGNQRLETWKRAFLGCLTAPCFGALCNSLGGAMTKEIELTQGMVALVDDEDYEMLMERSWYAACPVRIYYAFSSKLFPDGHRKTAYMHRLIMNARKGMEVDHINHNGLDNRRENLRLCNRKQNARNQRKQSGCSSDYKGVSWFKASSKWRAQIHKDKVAYYLGYFVDEAAAARAYNVAASELFGEFAMLNVIEE